MTLPIVKLGRTGLEVSRLCLGCMSYGVPERGTHPWTLGEAESRPFLKRALDLGFNFFDTANIYSDGTSEEICGSALLDYAPRHEIVIATKVNGRMHKGANGAGLSRKAIFAAVDASLQRLGTDFVDLYQIHRWDPSVPIEETMEALHDVVKVGKALHIGASSMSASARAETDAFGRTLYAKTQDADRTVVDAVQAVAARLGRPMAQVALAWVLSKPVISAPIVGATKLGQLDDAVAAVGLELSAEDVAALEAAYVPHGLVGFS